MIRIALTIVSLLFALSLGYSQTRCDKALQKADQNLADSLDSTNSWPQEAKFPGGKEKLYQYVLDRISLNGLSFNDLSGSKMFIQFDVDSLGKINNPKILQGVHPKLDAQMIEIFENMPHWIPKYELGKPIESSMAFPFIIEVR